MNTTRRNILRGMMGGGAVTVGLPFLDCFLNSNGTALANGAPLPLCFGTWVAGLGFNPGFWEPKTVGHNYENNLQFKPLDPFKDRINVFSGMQIFHDGKPPLAHDFGPGTYGAVPQGNNNAPSIDVLIGDVIGTRTRFRSLEVSYDGGRGSFSRRSGTAINPSEVSPAALYTRIFGPEFKDPNAADFTPDPAVMARRSMLSAVTEQRQDFTRDLGAADRARLDQYFTSLRQFEQQLDLQLQKPAPLEACTIPGKAGDTTVGAVIDDALANGKLFNTLLAHALACGQTQIFNVSGISGQSRKAGSTMTYHAFTHEEAVDETLGYQPNAGWFQERIVNAFVDTLKALDGIKEGDHTLLDRTLLYYTTDCGLAKLHSHTNMPMIVAGGAGGRMKMGYHIKAPGDTITRVGLTIQMAMGVPTSSWGIGENTTSKPIAELLA